MPLRNTAEFDGSDRHVAVENLKETQFALVTKVDSGDYTHMKQNVVNSNSIPAMIQSRERGLMVNTAYSKGNKRKLFNSFLPNSMSVLDRFQQKTFCGTYSKNGEYFVSAGQDGNIHIYSTKGSNYSKVKTVRGRSVGWSIIDTAFSPDGQYMVYSSWCEALHIFKLHGDSDEHKTLRLDPLRDRFCIFSVEFSSDGREILGGSSEGCIYVYDRELERRTLLVTAHSDDTNSVVYADETSQILYSGGDDCLAKIWDRRTLNENNPQPVGVLIGHTEGLTFINSRNDGRYLISNSKDQSIKLWDIRKVSPTVPSEQPLTRDWDYRWQEVPADYCKYKPYKVDGETAIMTYRGHMVTKTLIRCRFSPPETTGQRYIYTGCGKGRVVIYDVLTAENTSLVGHGGCVRDVSWHPYRHEIVSTSWDGVIGLWTRVHPDLVGIDEKANENKPNFRMMY